MNQMIEAWKEIPDLPDQVSSPPESPASFKGMRTVISVILMDVVDL